MALGVESLGLCHGFLGVIIPVNLLQVAVDDPVVVAYVFDQRLADAATGHGMQFDAIVTLQDLGILGEGSRAAGF